MSIHEECLNTLYSNYKKIVISQTLYLFDVLYLPLGVSLISTVAVSKNTFTPFFHRASFQFGNVLLELSSCSSETAVMLSGNNPHGNAENEVY